MLMQWRQVTIDCLSIVCLVRFSFLVAFSFCRPPVPTLLETSIDKSFKVQSHCLSIHLRATAFAVNSFCEHHQIDHLAWPRNEITLCVSSSPCECPKRKFGNSKKAGLHKKIKEVTRSFQKRYAGITLTKISLCSLGNQDVRCT